MERAAAPMMAWPSPPPAGNPPRTDVGERGANMSLGQRQLIRNAFVMRARQLEHGDQDRNQRDDDPRAVERLGHDHDDQDEEGEHRAHELFALGQASGQRDASGLIAAPDRASWEAAAEKARTSTLSINGME